MNGEETGEADALRTENERLQRLVDAYEKLTRFSSDELVNARDTLQAQERALELSREERLALRREIRLLQQGAGGLEDRIKAALSEDRANERLILDNLQNLQETSGNTGFYSDLFRVLVHYDFEPEDALRYWKAILERADEMRAKLGREISFRVAALDYFISENRILQNPKIIEISLFDEVLRHSFEDSLTGLYNRRFLDRALPREVQRARRHHKPVAVFLFDIDDFKRYNDSYGHAAGDRVMELVGKLLLACFRYEDIPCRYGGEEFVVILPETGASRALAVARRFMQLLAESDLDGRRVTISGGIADFPECAGDAGTLLFEADRALYQAKSAGKNSVLVAGDRGAA